MKWSGEVEKFVVTGGYNKPRTVTQFTEAGEVRYLARLNQGRHSHACSKFVGDDGETVSQRVK